MQIRLLIVSLLLGQWAYAEPNAAVHHTELEQVRQAINATQADLQQKQITHKNIQQTLKQAQQKLNKAQQDLHQLNKKQRHEWHHFNALQAELESLKIKVAGAKTQVARLFNSQYRNRHSNAIILFLQNAL